MGAVCSKQSHVAETKLRVNDVGEGGAEGRRSGGGLLQKAAAERAGGEALPGPIHVPALGAAPSIRLRDIPHVLDAILQHFKEDLKRVLPGSDDGQPIWPVERIPPPSSPVLQKTAVPTSEHPLSGPRVKSQ